MTRMRVDACVIGGGPAGAASALRLATLGHRVCLVERDGQPGAGRLESLAPPVRGLLQALGVLGRVQAAAFATSRCTLRRWAGEGAQRVGHEASLLVERKAFDALLLGAAAEAGVTMLLPGVAGRPLRAAGSEAWTVEVRFGATPLQVEAGFIVEAAGRRAGGAAAAAAPRSVALCGAWRIASPEGAAAMRVEALQEAWLWGAPLDAARHAALAFVDARACAGLRAAAREQLYRALLRQSALLGFCARGELLGPVRVRDASCRVAQPFAAERWIRAGDCAFAPDPCSSQGVQMALRGGLQAAAVVNTVLRGGDAQAACDFYRSAQEAAALQHRRHAAIAYSSQALYRSAFWAQRSAGADATPAPGTLPAGPPRPAPAVLHLSPQARICELPMLEADMIRRGPALSHPMLAQPLAWLGGLEVVPLLERCRQPRASAALIDEWAQHMPRAAACTMLDWLVRHEVLAQP